MPNSRILNQLRAATAVERDEVLARLGRYQALTSKINAYQNGVGPAPTVEEFGQWREDVEHSVALRRLQSGLPDA